MKNRSRLPHVRSVTIPSPQGEKMNERDIWTTAGFLIEHHGEQATIIAAQEADRFLEQGDMDQRRLWIRVMNAAASLIDVSSTKAN